MTTNQTCVSDQICLPGAEECLPLSPLFDSRFVISLLERQLPAGSARITKCGIKHVRYYPALFVTVSYQIEYIDLLTGAVLHTTIYANCSESGRWEQVQNQVVGRRWVNGALGLSYFIAQDVQTIFFEFPNDLEIPGLTILADRQELSLVLSGVSTLNQYQTTTFTPKTPQLEVAKYKPQNRCILRGDMISQAENGTGASMAPVIVRFDKVMNGCAAFELMRDLHLFFAAHPTVAVPRVLLSDESRHLSVVERVAGSNLPDLLSASDATEHLSLAIRGLVALHNYSGQGGSRIRPDISLLRAKRQTELVGLSAPEYRLQTDRILQQLQSLGRSTSAQNFGLVHGDFHPGQVLCNGDKCWFLDFHRSHYGETLADLGNLFSQLWLSRLKGQNDALPEWEQHCLEAYEQASGVRTSPARLQYWTVIGLLELGAKQSRGLKRSWPEKLARILQECENILDS